MSQVKEILIAKITNIVSNLLPNYFVDVYGSHASGLCLHWSDVDLVVGAQEDRDLQTYMKMDLRNKDSLRRISDALKGEIANKWITNVIYIEQTTVPVVKIKCSLKELMI